MAVVIDFCRKPGTGITALRSQVPFAGFDDWELPDDTARGDVAVLYAAGRTNAYLGTERITSSWRQMRGGERKGEWYVNTEGQRLFTRPVPAGEVEAALGLRRPRSPMRLSEPLGSDLLRYLRSRRRDPIEYAIEGIVTESRRTNRSRNPSLRREKLRQAAGRCEACGTDYSSWRGLEGTRVLTVHHRQQISSTDEPRESSLADLAVLCANCHMLVHADPRHATAVDHLAVLLRQI